MTDMETVQGAVERVLFEAPDSDYIVFRIRREDDESLLTVTGNGPKPLVGDRIEIMGRWTQHKKYGRQMAASAWKRLVPDTADGIERFLASGAVKASDRLWPAVSYRPSAARRWPSWKRNQNACWK